MLHVVTTMNLQGWRESGQRMVETFQQHWPKEQCALTIYAEGFDPDLPDVMVKSLPDWVEKFKAKHKDHRVHQGYRSIRPGLYDYRFDAVKFSHKVGALTDFGRSIHDGLCIWMDADTITHAPVTRAWLEGMFPKPSYVAWLDRTKTHIEAGFAMFRASHPHHAKFMGHYQRLYETDAVLTLRETHDSFALQTLVQRAVAHGWIEKPVSLSGPAVNWHHPFAAGPLGERMDHLKGPRKDMGRSPIEDARGRSEAYWNEGDVGCRAKSSA